MHKIYIDNIIGLGLDLSNCNNRQQSQAVRLLTIDACSRRIHDNEPIPCHNMDALHKLSMEGCLKETKMILVWLWDFLRLKISSPLKNSLRGCQK
jgi:hypothetical protein